MTERIAAAACVQRRPTAHTMVPVDVNNRSSAYRSLLTAAAAIFLVAASVHATVRVSHDDGRWQDVYWMPSGQPQPGDTIIIASRVTGMPEGTFGRLVIRPQGTLTIAAGHPSVRGALIEGSLAIDGGATLRVAGHLGNTGTITGDGAVEMVTSGAIVSGSGRYTHLTVAVPYGGSISLGSATTIPSLTLAAGARLLAGIYDLTIDGPYYAVSGAAEQGIVASGGVIHLNGSVYGNARGDVDLGAVAGAVPPRRPHPPTVTGIIGDAGRAVTVRTSRDVSFSTFIGDVAIDSGAVVQAAGIGSSGECRLVGNVTVRGTLRAGDPAYRWVVEGELFNEGAIEECSIRLSGEHARLRSDRGRWDPSIRLEYVGTSGSRLAVESALVLSTLSIVPRTPLDSDVAVVMGGNPLRIRHRFESDIARGCRITTDTVVRVWDASNGAIDGAVIFEGFWGSGIAGTYGRAGRPVEIVTQKRFEHPVRIAGDLVVDPAARLTVAAAAEVHGAFTANGVVTLAADAVLTLDSGGSVRRDLAGDGTILVLGATPSLDAAGHLRPGVRLVVGDGTSATRLQLGSTLHAADLRIAAGSSLEYADGDSLDIADSLRIDVRYLPGFNLASVPCRAFDVHAGTVFPADTSVLKYDGAYVPADSVEAGRGYFVRFSDSVTVTFRGRPVNAPLEIPVVAGWNLVGAPSIPVATAAITVSGTTLLSGFVPAIGGSPDATVLLPGRAYWVHAAGVGTLTLRP